MNNFLALAAFVACGWVASNVVLPEPAAGGVPSRSTLIAAPAFTSEPITNRNVLEARQSTGSSRANRTARPAVRQTQLTC